MAFPSTLTDSNPRRDAGSRGLVPLRYSARFDKPSPSESNAASEGSSGLREYWSSQASGSPSPSRSSGAPPATPGVGRLAPQFKGSLPLLASTSRCKANPPPLALAGQG